MTKAEIEAAVKRALEATGHFSEQQIREFTARILKEMEPAK